MKKLWLFCCITFVSNAVIAAAKPALFKDVEESGFGKAVDAGNFQAALDAFRTNKVSGTLLKQNALEYLYMTVDMPGLNDHDQGLIEQIIKSTPPSLSLALRIAPMNRKWLVGVLPDHGMQTKGDTDAPPISEDPRQIGNLKAGFSYEGLISFWNKGKWDHATSVLERMDRYIPRLVNPKAFKSLLQLLFGNTPYEVWVKMDADPRSRLAALAHKHGVETPAAAVGPLPPPAPGPIPPPAPVKPRKENVVIKDSPYSYASVKKAWEGKQWDFVLAGFIAFDMHVPKEIPRDVMQVIVEDLLKATAPADWASMAPKIREDFEYILKQYGHDMPRVPAPVPPPPDISTEPVYSYEVAKKAWQARKWQQAFTNLQNFEANPGVFTNKPMSEVLAEMVRDTPVADWNKIASGTRNGLEKLLKQYGVNPPLRREPPLPPIPGPKPPKPLPPTPQKPPAPKPGPLPQLPIEALYQKLDVALKGDNVRGALEIITKEAQPTEIKRALTRMLIEVHPRKLLAQKDLLRSILGGLSAADQDELIRTFEATITGPDGRSLATFLRTGALPVAPPLPPAPGPKPSKPLPPTPPRPSSPPLGPLPPVPAPAPAPGSDAKAIKDASGQDFDAAMATLHTVVATDSADFRTAIDNLFTKPKPGFKGERERDSVLDLVKKAYPDKDARDKFYSSIHVGLRGALRKAEEEEDEESDEEPDYYSPASSRVPTPVPHPTPPIPTPQPKPALPQPQQPAVSSGLAARNAQLLKEATGANFDQALKLLSKVSVPDSDDFRAVLTHVLSNIKDPISDTQESLIWALLRNSHPDEDQLNKFVGTLPAHVQEALKKGSW